MNAVDNKSFRVYRRLELRKTSGDFLPQRFAREIWKSFRISARERSEYLKNLLSEIVPKFEPLLYLDVGAGLGYNTNLRFFYKIALRIGLIKAIPLGYLIVAKKGR